MVNFKSRDPFHQSISLRGSKMPPKLVYFVLEKELLSFGRTITASRYSGRFRDFTPVAPRNINSLLKKVEFNEVKNRLNT